MTGRKRYWRFAAAAFIAALAQAGSAASASAQADCAAQKEPERVRCEQQKRVEKECAGRTGEALALCRSAVLEPAPERRDCSRLPEGYGRYKCEDENLRAEVEARCGAKSGEAYRRCYADVMAKAPAR